MDITSDVHNILSGVMHAQMHGKYKLEESEQLAPVVRRILERFPKVQSTEQVVQPPVQLLLNELAINFPRTSSSRNVERRANQQYCCKKR